jgi:hypothetical protein
MADNPLTDTPEREQRIRERAYQLWEADGRPHGRDQEYWERARELVAIEESAGAGLLPNPETHPTMLSGEPQGVEEAEIQENYGEFPDRFTDQGDRVHTPKARRSKLGARKTLAKATSRGAPKSAGSR